jgi:crossover junction endodeoxyribonuclease RuvC
MSTFIGIDPGQSGGIAVLADSAPAIAWKMPETERDVWDLFPSYMMAPDAFAMIEKVASRPGQGVASMFKFGKNYGMLRGMLVAACIPFAEVPPGVWQKSLGCLSKGDKNVTKARAQQLFPTLKITHATADALLLAEYCRRKRNGTL